MSDFPNWPDGSSRQADTATPPTSPPPPPTAPTGADAWPADLEDVWREPVSGGSGRPTWLVVSLVAAVLGGLLSVAVAGVLVVRSLDDDTPVAQAEDAVPEPGVEDLGGVPFDDPTFDDDAVAAPEDAVTAELLTLIDESEQTMIEFQADVFQTFDVEGGFLAGGEEQAVEAARAGADRLEAIDVQLAALQELEGGAATAGQLTIRDTYAEHLGAWEGWMRQVAERPDLLLNPGDPDASAASADIESTAVDFVRALRRGLPQGTPPELQDYADFIVDRGFSGTEADSGDLV